MLQNRLQYRQRHCICYNTGFSGVRATAYPTKPASVALELLYMVQHWLRWRQGHCICYNTGFSGVRATVYATTPASVASGPLYMLQHRLQWRQGHCIWPNIYSEFRGFISAVYQRRPVDANNRTSSVLYGFRSLRPKQSLPVPDLYLRFSRRLL
jgi:hypothetical protein